MPAYRTTDVEYTLIEMEDHIQITGIYQYHYMFISTAIFDDEINTDIQYLTMPQAHDCREAHEFGLESPFQVYGPGRIRFLKVDIHRS